MSRGANVNSRGVTQSGRGLRIGSADTTVLTWETASDWDNAVSESGVAHEAVTNTDHTDAGVLKQGYSRVSPVEGANLFIYYPFDEDSGTTAYDVSGNNNDGTISGATVNQTGILGTTGYSFDGTDDYVDPPGNVGAATDFTWTVWCKPTLDGSEDRTLDFRDNPGILFSFEHSSTSGSVDVFEGGTGTWNDNITTVSDQTWVMLSFAYDDSATSMEVYKDAVSQGTISIDSAETGKNNRIGADQATATTTPYDGKIEEFFFHDTLLSGSQIQTLYDTVDTVGTLTSATKTFTSATAPDLQNLSYTLNGVTDIQLDVIGSPGTADEEIVTQQLAGASSYTLSWANTHTDFRVKPYPDNEGDVTRTPTINRLELA